MEATLDAITKKLDEDICKLFENKQEAKEFLLLYSEMGGLIDDIVDEQKNTNTIRRGTLLLSKCYNCNYWLKWHNSLLVTDRLIHNQYFDSVEWESSYEQWKREHAKVYSHAGIQMTLAVILIEFGDIELEKWSLRFREYAYNRHKEDKI